MQAPSRGAMHEDGLPLIRNPKGPEEWRVNREVRFTWRQQREREWIPFREIAEWFAELNGGGANEAARASAYEMLQHDFLNGDFEEAGRSRILYLHFRTPMAKMTRNRLQTAIDTLSDEDVRLQYLGRCWLPEPMFQRWLAKHELPLSPPRFEPRRDETEIETLPPRRRFPRDAVRDTQIIPSNSRRRGPKPEKSERTKEAMRRDIRGGLLTTDQLSAMLEKDLVAKYGVSRTTARDARKVVLSEFVGNSTSTNDK
jgi:hypothetical protein